MTAGLAHLNLIICIEQILTRRVVFRDVYKSIAVKLLTFRCHFPSNFIHTKSTDKHYPFLAEHVIVPLIVLAHIRNSTHERASF